MIFNKFYLDRLIDNGKETLGVFAFPSIKKIVAFPMLELPWLNNREDVSCIAPGIYPWVKYLSPDKGYWVILLKNVPGRTNVEIHIANYVSQLRGCMSPGKETADINGDGLIDVSYSKVAFDELMGLAPESGTITISDKNLVRINLPSLTV